MSVPNLKKKKKHVKPVSSYHLVNIIMRMMDQPADRPTLAKQYAPDFLERCTFTDVRTHTNILHLLKNNP